MGRVPNEEKPVPLVPDTYVPPWGVQRLVGKRETWGTVATAAGIADLWDLIDFNFPGTKRASRTDAQRAARNVNWYLREYVGCQLSLDGENWAFDPGPVKGLGKGGWRGGHIYVPKAPPPPRRTIRLCSPTSSGKLGKRPDGYRLMTAAERTMAATVFGQTLPWWKAIGIGDGLGFDGRPWTDMIPMSAPGLSEQLQFEMNLGDSAGEDLTKTIPSSCYTVGGTGNLNDLLIHELTHVWQYHNQTGVTGRLSVWASSVAGSYDFSAGGSWDSYDVEQQASIVEQWFHDTTAAPATRKTHPLYPYIRLVILTGRSKDALSYVSGLNLNELNRDVVSLKARGLD